MEAAEILPTHIGIILDGNRRWARARGLPTLEGHRRGYGNLKKIAYAAKNRNIKFVSAFIFSTENWSRSNEEVNYLMDLVLEIFAKDALKMVKDGFKIVVLGRPNGVRAKIRQKIAAIEEKSAQNTGTTLALCFNYGGQWEIADSVKNVFNAAANEFLAKKSEECSENAQFSAQELTQFVEKYSEKITPETVAQNLYHPEVPPCDIIVRTSGEERLSGFQLWRAAYAELMFMEKYWPDFDEADFDAVIAEFAHRSRRFGK